MQDQANDTKLYHGRLFAAIALLAVVQLTLAVRSGVLEGHLSDPDSYTWMNRVTLLYDAGHWFDSTNPRIDPPYGHENHWSRPYDLLLLIGGWIGAPLFGFENALHGWGVLLNLVLHVLALLAMIWAFLPMLRKLELDVLGFLFVPQMGILVSYYVGRPDHQSLLSILFIFSAGLMVRLAMDCYRWKLGCAFGLVSAIGIWVGVEFVLTVMVILATLGFIWIWEGKGFSEKAWHYSLMLFLGTSVALFLEEGPDDFLVPMLDQISIAFVFLFGLIAVFWGTMYRLESWKVLERSWRSRLALASVAGGVSAGLMEIFFPGFFDGPGKNVDSLYWTTRTTNISEGRPLLDFSTLSSENWAGRLTEAFFWLGISIPAIPLLVHRLVNKSGPERRFWIFVAIGLLVYIPLALERIRWIPYSVTLLLPLYTVFVAWLLDSISHRLPPVPAAPLRVFALVLCSIGFLLPMLANDKNAVGTAKKSCSLVDILSYLNDPNGLGARQKNLLAFVDFGPELVYRTPHAVFSYPNHRWQPGYTDSYNIFTATENEKARALVQKRNVDLILVCPMGPEARIFSREDGQVTFHERLSRGVAPAWLEDISPPATVSDSFKLYEVRTQRPLDDGASD